MRQSTSPNSSPNMALIMSQLHQLQGAQKGSSPIFPRLTLVQLIKALETGSPRGPGFVGDNPYPSKQSALQANKAAFFFRLVNYTFERLVLIYRSENLRRSMRSICRRKVRYSPQFLVIFPADFLVEISTSGLVRQKGHHPVAKRNDISEISSPSFFEGGISNLRKRSYKTPGIVPLFAEH